MTYLILLGVSLGVLLVVIPSLAVIIVILKNGKLREKNNNIFYVNLLIADVLTVLVRLIITIDYLGLPIVNCNVLFMLMYSSFYGNRLMFLSVVIDRLLVVALPFSYKRIVTTKRVGLTITGLWLLAFALGVLGVVSQDYDVIPQHGMCIHRGSGSNPLLFLMIVGTLVVSICIITGTSIYLRYKIIHSNQFFRTVKRTPAEEQKAVRVGRLVEILQEQMKPTFSVFIAGGFDAVFNALTIIMFFLDRMLCSSPCIVNLIALLLSFCQYFSHAVVYAVRDKDIRKEILEVYKSIRGPKKSKVVPLTGQ